MLHSLTYRLTYSTLFCDGRLGSLVAEELHVDGGLNLNRSALFDVDLDEATVGSLTFKEAEIHPGRSISLMNAKVERELNLTNLKVLPLKPAGENPWALDLTQATVGYLHDDSKSWPDNGQLSLDGFVYGRFQGDETPRTARWRLDWIRRQLRPEMPTWRERVATVFKGVGAGFSGQTSPSGRPHPSAAATPSGTPTPGAAATSSGDRSKPAHVFATQPYLQLAKVLREAGDDPGATQVLIGMERDRHRLRRVFWLETPLAFLQALGLDSRRYRGLRVQALAGLAIQLGACDCRRVRLRGWLWARRDLPLPPLILRDSLSRRRRA